MLNKSPNRASFYDVKAKVYFIDSDLYVKCKICSSLVDRCHYNSHILKHFFLSDDSVENFIKYKSPQTCPLCQKFKSTSVTDLLNHEIICSKNDSFLFCMFCNEKFYLDLCELEIKYIYCKYNEKFASHVKNHFLVDNIPCKLCGLLFISEDDLNRHQSNSHLKDEKNNHITNLGEIFSIKPMSFNNLSVKSSHAVNQDLAVTIEKGLCFECGSNLGTFPFNHFKNCYRCMYCSYLTNCDNSAWNHMKNHDINQRKKSKGETKILGNYFQSGCWVDLTTKFLSNGQLFSCECGFNSKNVKGTINHKIECQRDSRLTNPQNLLKSALRTEASENQRQ